jgi:Tfp pilus assembly protein PilX
MVVGRLGAMELAAAGISTDLSYQMCIVLMGFFSVVGVLVYFNYSFRHSVLQRQIAAAAQRADAALRE